MFERYTERARRVIFFARYEASQFGSMTIETEHLLLGLIREDKNLTNRFLPHSSSIESIRKDIERRTEVREKVPTSIDLPLSNECNRILAYANEEAERLKHRHIGTGQILLGILREEKCVAAEILYERGLRHQSIREELARTINTADELSAMPTSSNTQVAAALEKHGLVVSREHLIKAWTAKHAGDRKTAQNELQLFLENLVDTIHERNAGDDILTPVFEGFDWRQSLRGFHSGLPDDEDWRFRFGLTILLAELLLERYEHRA